MKKITETKKEKEKEKQLQDNFRREIEKELGLISAIFMSQKCKGTQIIMPTEELIEATDRIELYAFKRYSNK